jgi:uncharacterized protein with HEPN domain
MSRSMLGFLQHILNETQYLMDRAEAVTKGEFLRDEKLKRAFVRNLEIIGEAVNRYRTILEGSIVRSNGEQWQGWATV